MKIINKYPLVYLEWADAISDTGWMKEETLFEWGKTDDWIVKNVGWLLKETKEYILLTSKYSEITKEWGLMHKIPTTWIKKKKLLKI